MLGYALIFSGALMFFAIISPTEGTITKGIADFLGGFVGRIGLIPVAISSAAIGLWLFIRHFNENPLVIQAHRAAGYALMFIAFITTAHAIEMLNHPVANMQGLIRVSDALVKLPTHPGGGWLGGTIYKALIGVSGEIGVWVILVGFWLVSLMLSFSITLAEISAYIKSVFQWFARVRRSYLDHRAASAQAKAAAAPLTIESPSPVGVGATPAAATLGAGPTPNKKGIPIPERTGVQASVGAPRLAPATAPAASPAAASKPAASSPFGKAPAQAVRNEDVDDDELEKSATPVPTRPAPLGTSCEAKSGSSRQTRRFAIRQQATAKRFGPASGEN